MSDMTDMVGSRVRRALSKGRQARAGGAREIRGKPTKWDSQLSRPDGGAQSKMPRGDWLMLNWDLARGWWEETDDSYS